MQGKLKTVALDDVEFQVGKLPTGAGSFILMRLMGAYGLSRGSLAGPVEDTPAEVAAVAPTGEELVRAVCFAAFMRGLSFEDSQFIQRECMKVASRWETAGGQRVAMPVMADNGKWVIEEVGDSIGLVTRLTMEVLVHNLADFFSGGGTAKMMGAPQ
jgi:hypothetical protein